VPVLLVSAPASSHGKTSVVAALARLHTRQGRRVRVFKCGPDFLDPQIHALVSGAPCENIDLRMCGLDDARWRLARAAAECELILIEGVMGLMDGQPNAAELARMLGLPILLVVDASAMAGCFGALVWGLTHYRQGAPITQVLANRVGSAHHAELCRATLPEDVAWAGFLPRLPAAQLPERHLGLLPAAEIKDLMSRLDLLADALADSPCAALPPSITLPAASAPASAPRLAGQRIAIARDAAHCFIYPANLECLQQLGAEMVFFSPLAHESLPECDAIWLPGGYPELHAARLAAHPTLRAQLKAHVTADKPLLAECGGMLSCFETLVDQQGEAHTMYGLLPGVAHMHTRLAGLGMLHLELPPGELSGHSFHYARHTTSQPVWRSAHFQGKPGAEAVYRRQCLVASYMHSYFPSQPAACAWLFGAQRPIRQQEEAQP
jgi:cobyrinic acid a,c-diamide synthase